MKALGIILTVLGIIALFYGGISYTRREKVVDVGPIEAYADKKERIPMSPVVGGVALLAGVVLLVSSRRRAV